MRAFWMAWGLAVLLLVTGTLGAVWIFGASAEWPVLARVLARIAGVALLLCMFVGAFRSGLLATMSLKQVLAENLAIVIAMELDDLRRAAEHHALALNLEAEPARTPDALAIPRFFGDRDEIRRLLGKATEHTLEEIHASLQSFNEAARGTSDTESRQRMQGKAAAIQEQVGRAARLLNQFMPSGSAA